MKTLPIVTIVGRPNVGKSTLFNRIIGKRVALEFPEAGTTRDRLYGEAEWRSKRFLLADTAGLAFSKKDQPLFAEISEQIQVALAEADLILFMVDGKEGLTAEDKSAANIIRKSGQPVILVVNKMERPTPEKIAEYYQLGLGEPFALAAISGVRVGDLLDQVVRMIKKIKALTEREIPKNTPTLVILGRPNVGKSSLLNTLAGEKRAIVTDIPGTTRDVLDTQVEYQGKNYRFLDTAGLRRRGKVKRGIESLSVLRAIRALTEADIALLVISADEPLANQDLHVAGYTKEEGKGLIILVNKWDLVKSQITNLNSQINSHPTGDQPKADRFQISNHKQKQETMESVLMELERRFAFAPYAPVIFVSAKTGQNIEHIFEVVDQIWESRNKKIKTSELNKIIGSLNLTGKLPAKIFYATQTGSNPPRFWLFVKDPRDWHFSNVRFLDRELHQAFDLIGTPVKIYFKKPDNKSRLS